MLYLIWSIGFVVNDHVDIDIRSIKNVNYSEREKTNHYFLVCDLKVGINKKKVVRIRRMIAATR